MTVTPSRRRVVATIALLGVVVGSGCLTLSPTVTIERTESTRERTPLGHTHREQIRDLSVSEIREMYRQAVKRLLNEVAETKEFFRAGIVAIDITEDDPFTGDRTGHEDEIVGYEGEERRVRLSVATVQLVGNAVPIVLDARPVRKSESRLEIVNDLLDSAENLVHVDNVLMDRAFDSQHVLEMISQRELSYVVRERMQTSEKAQEVTGDARVRSGGCSRKVAFWDGNYHDAIEYSLLREEWHERD